MPTIMMAAIVRFSTLQFPLLLLLLLMKEGNERLG